MPDILATVVGTGMMWPGTSCGFGQVQPQCLRPYQRYFQLASIQHKIVFPITLLRSLMETLV